MRSHAAYSTTRARARTAASTAGYDGTDPRPAVDPATSGTRSSSGTPSLPRKVDTSGLSDCSPTAASTLATSSPVVLSGGMNTATTESTSGSSIAASSASSKSSAVASGAERHRLADHEAHRGGGVGGEQAERVGVADDRDPAAARQRLVGDELGDVEHLVEGVDLDHPGLAEHRVHRGLRAR